MAAVHDNSIPLSNSRGRRPVDGTQAGERKHDMHDVFKLEVVQQCERNSEV